jgi:hypothetical protein
MNLGTILDLQANRPLEKRLRWHGFDISIETAKGSIRKGVDPNGKPWSVKMSNDYGYLRLTQGVDGDHLDCFIGPNPSAQSVYVIHTLKAPDFKDFDEDKCFLNFPSAAAAKKAFLANYDKPDHFGSMDTLSVTSFIQKAKASKETPQKIAAASYGR